MMVKDNLFKISFALYVAVFANSIFLASSTCMQYSGSVCDRKVRIGLSKNYTVPNGKTQKDIDKEITDAIQEHPLKYIACKHYIKYLMCSDKFRGCGKHKAPCRESCDEVKKSICFKDLDRTSKIYKWLTEEFICDKLPQEECETINERTDLSMIEISCKNEHEKPKGAKIYQMSMLSLRTKPSALNKDLLLKQFPMYLNDDLECDSESQQVSSITKKIIIPLKTLVISKLKERTVAGYCHSPSTKTTVIPVAKLERYNLNEPRTPNFFKHTEIFIVDKEGDANAFITVAGTNSVCLNFGSFHYSIFQSTSDVDYYYGVSSKKVFWKWVDQAEGNLQGQNAYVRSLMGRLKILQTLTLSKPTQIVAWNGNHVNKLFSDKNTSISISFPDRIEMEDFAYKYPERNILFQNVNSSIAISGNGKEKCAIFQLKFTSGMKLADLVWILMGGGEVFEQLDCNFDLKIPDMYAVIQEIEFFFQVKRTEINLPKSTFFSEMKNLLATRKHEAIFVKAFGKITNAKKPTWIDAGDFALTYKLDETTMEPRLELEFQPEFTMEQCAMKQNQSRDDFNTVLATIDYMQWESYEDSTKMIIGKSKHRVKCDVCCNYDKALTLKKITVDIKLQPRSITADIQIVYLNTKKEIIFKVKDFNLMIERPEKVVENKRDYFKEFM